MKWQAVIGIFISTLLFGCSYSKMKDPALEGNNSRFSLPADQRANLSYAYLAQNVLTPKCVSCHGTSGGVSLESYQAVVGHAANVKKTVFETHTMPKNGSLSEREMSVLWTWIEMGMPEQAQGGGPGDTPIPLGPTFESIDKNIFQAKCVTCHSPAGTGKRIPLGKDDLLNSPLELVIPGNADESGLVIAVERADDKRMPPASEGYSALKPEERQAIRDWIQNGASD